MKNLLCVALVLVLAASAGLAEPPTIGEGKGQVVLSWDEFVTITGYDPAAKGGQVITVPWAEVEAMLGVKVETVGEGSTVDLPWKEFKALLEWSLKKKDGEGSTPAPADYVVTSSQFTGTLGEDSAQFKRTIKLNILKAEGWTRINILPRNVAIMDKDLPDGVYLNSSKSHYELLTEKTGPIEVSVTFSAKVTTSRGQSSLNIADPLNTSSLVDLTFEKSDVDMTMSNAQTVAEKTVDGKTHYVAALPAGAGVAISYQRAIEKVQAAKAKLYAETRTLVAVSDSALLCQELINYRILHAGVRTFELTVPEAASVLAVSGSHVEDWRVNDKSVLQVQLSREATGSQVLQVSYESTNMDKPVVPVIRTRGTIREKGYVGAVALANVELGAGKVTGATPIDVRQLPTSISSLTNQPLLLGFRYVGETFTLPLTIKKHAELPVLTTVIDSAVYTGMQLNDGRRMTRVSFAVRNNRSQFLRLTMPAGADIWSAMVSGKTVTPATDEQGHVLVRIPSSSQAQDLSSFPVVLVYVETPAKPAPATGSIKVALPTIDVPQLHVMYNYYLPAEGDYTVGWGRMGFSGNMELVKDFAKAVAGRAVQQVDAQANNAEMAEQFQAQQGQAARAEGSTPIRVKLPVKGTRFRLQRILALPGDTLSFQVQYRNWGKTE